MSSCCAGTRKAYQLARQWYGHTAGILLIWTRLGVPLGLAAGWLSGGGWGLPLLVGPLAAGCYAAGYIALRASGSVPPLQRLKLVDSLLLCLAFGSAGAAVGAVAPPALRVWLGLPVLGLLVAAWLLNWQHEGRPERPGEGGLPAAPRFRAPVTGPVSAGYRSYDRSHTGVDFAVPVGTRVGAPADGRVVHAGPLGQWGYAAEVDHGEGWSTFYAHLERPLVRAGDGVAAGAVIALTGTSGISTGPHLHLELRYRGVPVDPAPLLG
jgi:hypothetical protein